jgi:hypothetical protein
VAKSRKTQKSSVKVRDLKAKKDPKGGAVDMFMKVNTSMGDGSVTKAINFTDISSLNFKK